MQKFLQAVIASALFLMITTAMASERGHRVTVRENRSAVQSRIPPRAAAGRMVSLGSSPRNIAEEETIWQDDFEQGVNGWTVESAFDRQTYWHPSSQGAFGGSGSSYWCGDPALNGYDNDWFQLLVTPEIDLSGTTAPTLTFKHNYAVEDPAGASQSIPQVDGWPNLHHATILSHAGAAVEGDRGE